MFSRIGTGCEQEDQHLSWLFNLTHATDALWAQLQREDRLVAPDLSLQRFVVPQVEVLCAGRMVDPQGRLTFMP